MLLDYDKASGWIPLGFLALTVISEEIITMLHMLDYEH